MSKRDLFPKKVRQVNEDDNYEDNDDDNDNDDDDDDNTDVDKHKNQRRPKV